MICLLGLLALMRFVAWDDAEPLVVVNAMTMFVYLPAWLVAAVAVLSKRWMLLVAAIVIVGAQIAYVSPELLSSKPLPEWTHHASKMRLFDANVDKSTDFALGYSLAMARDHPDIVMLEELTPAGLQSLIASGALKALPFHCFAPEPGANGLLMASRFPMSRCRIHRVLWAGGDTPYMASATLRTHSGPVNLRVVHTLAPLPVSWDEWTTALQAIDRLARTSPTGNMLLVGDFNSTWNNRWFAALLSDGLTDAAAARGVPFAMTWPEGAIVPPFVRIDHVLTGKGLCVTHISTHMGFRSDHHYLTATVDLRRGVRSGG